MVKISLAFCELTSHCTLWGLKTALITRVFIVKSADLGVGLLQHIAEVFCVTLDEISMQRIPKARGKGRITKRSLSGGPAPIV